MNIYLEKKNFLGLFSNPYIILTLLTISIFTMILFLDTEKSTNNIVVQHLNYLNGEPYEFKEPWSTGLSLIIYFSNKLINSNPFWILKLYQLLFLIGSILLTYRITESSILTLFMFIYSPFILNSYSTYTSAGVFFHLIILYFLLKRKILQATIFGIPLILIRPETFMIYPAFFIYDIIYHNSYKSFKSIIIYLKKNLFPIILIICSIVVYLSINHIFYGSIDANMNYNVLDKTENFNPGDELNFGFVTYAIRFMIFAIMAVTSIMLFSKNKLLFTINTTFLLTYSLVSLTGYYVLFFAIMRFYSGMIIYTLLAWKYYIE